MSDPKYTSYFTEERAALPFCPGCGHTKLVKALDKAMVKLQLDPAKTVIVTDIGCIGLADRNFTTSAFHGLHGRSITYACGLKLARPELTVITLMGDGACGIGGTHLLNVARRNIGITLLIGNNFNYGMTGGQHSVTSFHDGVTASTPWGNVEQPMDLCATAAAAGAAWVYRATTYEENLSDVIAEAIEQPGFAMMDVWEQCTAYYAARNKVKKSRIYELLTEHDFPLGLVADKPRPEYSAQFSTSFEAAKSVIKEIPPIEATFNARLDKQIGVILAGSAGKKVKSTATLLARAGIASGLVATQKDDYPITVMTGHSVSEVIVSPERIDYTGIDAPDYLIVLSGIGLGHVAARFPNLPEHCVVYADDSLDLPETPARVVKLPFEQTAKKVNRLGAGVIAIATLLGHSGIFGTDALESIVRTFQSQKIADMNIKAVAAGLALAAPLD
jgi:2-oxoglutarate/2-oxoacid ferredoxin oxidoreductase subunit beta